jgi:hypothetical protein
MSKFIIFMTLIVAVLMVRLGSAEEITLQPEVILQNTQTQAPQNTQDTENLKKRGRRKKTDEQQQLQQQQPQQRQQQLLAELQEVHLFNQWLSRKKHFI